MKDEQIEKLTQLGTKAVESAIESYTGYFIAWSWAWLVFGILCAAGAVILYKKRKEPWMEFYVLGVFMLVLISLATIPFNIPRLLHPRAYAIHQLLQDAR